jgi:hypothetical protein
MTLSELTVKLKAKGLTKQEALEKCKATVKKQGKKWTVKQQSTFDEFWKKRLKPKVERISEPIAKPVKPQAKPKLDGDYLHVPPEPQEDDLEKIIGDIHLPRDITKMTDYQKMQIKNWMYHRPKAEVNARMKALAVLMNIAARKKDTKLLKYARVVSDIFYEAKLLRKRDKVDKAEASAFIALADSVQLDTKAELLKAIPKAKIITGYVKFTVHDGLNFKLSKADVIDAVKNCDDDTEFTATLKNGRIYFG